MRDNEAQVHTAHTPREGWEEAFKKMAERGDDRILDEPTPTASDDEEWEW